MPSVNFGLNSTYTVHPTTGDFFCFEEVKLVYPN